jgi:hypothetical protein
MANVEGGRLRQISQNMQEEVHTVLEEGFSHACQSTAVKDHLFKAVRLENNEEEVDFTFGEKLLLPDAKTLNPLKVENLGDILIPVSVKVLTVYVRRVTIKKVFSNTLNETGSSKAEKNI